LINIK